MKKVYMFLVGFIIIGAISFSLLKDTENRNKVDQDILTVSGILETNETDVNVKVGGKILEIMVEEGDTVKKGDIIATVEAENIEAKLEQAKALLGIATTRVEQSKIAYEAQKEQSESQIKQANGAYSSAKAQLDKAKKGARPQQLEQAKEVVNQAREAYEYTKLTYDRLEKLFKEGVIPQQKMDGAKAELEVSKARLNQAEQQYGLVKEGAQLEDIKSAEGLVSQAEAFVNLANVTKLQVSAREQDMIAARAQQIQAQAAVDEVMSYINDSSVKAPVSGTITIKNADKGELVSTGMPIISIANLKDVWANIKVKETAIADFKVGDTVDVMIPGDANKIYKGKVTSIASKPSFATERATQDKGSKDIVAFAVKIKLENEDLRLKPGMTATINLQKIK
jgi:HlyD family secretion protein